MRIQTLARRPKHWRLLVVGIAAAAAALAVALPGMTAGPSPIVVEMSAPIHSSAGTTYPQYFQVARVYASWINSQGGIEGHPLKVVYCDDQNDPNLAQSCARTGVSDHVVACVGCFSLYSDNAVPIFAAANIPYFGDCCAAGSQEFTSPVSFPLGAGVAIAAGEALEAGKVCQKPSLMVIGGIPSTGFLTSLSKTAIAHTGKSFVNVVPVPVTPGDYSSELAQATAGGPDCLVGVLSESQWGALLPEMKQAGVTQRIIGIAGNLDSKVIGLAPSITNNAIITGYYPDISEPVWANYRTALKKYKANTAYDYAGLNPEGAWNAFTAFTQIIEKAKLKTITNTTFLAAANQAVVNTGILPKISFKHEWSFPGFGRLFDRVVTYQVVKNGKIVPLDDKFHDTTYSFK